MQDSRRIFDYFLVAGLPDNPVELKPGAQECGYRETAPQAPITDLCVVFPSLGEEVPEGFTCVELTPTGYSADLNHGSLRVQPCFLCYKRGFHKPPIVDIGVLYEGKGEKPLADSSVVKTTPSGRAANVNNAKEGIFLTFRRAPDNAHNNLFSVSDVCIILANKGETPPHTFYKINKNLNRALVGSDVYLCYKKSLSSINRIAYKPELLDRFPLHDVPDYPLPDNVPIFCLPMGAVIECWPAKCQVPPQQFSTFVLTNQDGQKFYGASVAFYEDYEKPLTADQTHKLGLSNESSNKPGSCSESSSNEDPTEQMTFHVNKCICVVSRFPFFAAFRRYLFYLYHMCLGGAYALPLERYVSFVMFEVPFPTFRRPRVLVQLGNEKVCFDNPEDSPMPLSGANYLDFLKLLGPENCIYLMLIVLLEQKVLIHSLRPWNLTSVAEAVCNLIFPFRWQCPYIPQCPLDLAGVLHAPMPFVAGVDSSYFELYQDPPKDVTCVDLDTNTISLSEVRLKYKIGLLPRRAVKVLKQQLETLLTEVSQLDFKTTKAHKVHSVLPVDIDLQLQQKRKKLEMEVQEAFLRFMASLLKDYQNYLKPIQSAPSIGSTDLRALFDVNGFLRSRDKASQEFYKLLVNTQLFIRFIEERSFLTDKDTNAYLAFFDDCVQKLLDHSAEGGVKLLDQDALFGGDAEYDHAVLFAPPESPSGCRYSYERKFPVLDHSRFCMEAYSDMIKPADPSKRLRLIELTPAAKRTRQETKSALDLARRQAKSPLGWAKCLLSYAYSIWFIHMPALMKVVPDKTKALNAAHCLLKRMESARFISLDEVCYRTMIQMCGLYEQPLLAVQVFVSMNKHGVRPNAVTYGIYNRSVLDCQWPGSTGDRPQRHWTKVRHAVEAVSRLKRLAKQRSSLDNAHGLQTATKADEKLVNGSVMLSTGCNEENSISERQPVERKRSICLLSRMGTSAEWPRCSRKRVNLSGKRWLSDCDLAKKVGKHTAKRTSGRAVDFLNSSSSAVVSESRKADSSDESQADGRRDVIFHPLAVLETNLEMNGTAKTSGVSHSQPSSPYRNLDKFYCADGAKLFADDDELPSNHESGGSRFAGFRDLFSRINEATSAGSAASLLVRLRRGEDAGTPRSCSLSEFADPVFPVSSSVVNALADDTCDSVASSDRSFVSSSFTSRLSTSLADAHNKVVSKMTVLQKQSGGGLARIKSNVSSVLNDIRHLKSFDQLGTQVRGSWSSLSLGEAATVASSEGRLSAEDSTSIKDDLHPHADEFDSKLDLPLEDAAFRLSSPSVRRMLNFNAMNGCWTMGDGSPGDVEVLLCATSRCPSCSILCYDDEIMAGWFADESQLNTQCAFCRHKFVPILTVVVQPLKRAPSHSWYHRKGVDEDGGKGDKEYCWKSLDSLVVSDPVDETTVPGSDDRQDGASRCRRRGSRRCDSGDWLSLPVNRRLFHSADGRGERLVSLADSVEVASSLDADNKRQSYTVPFLNLLVLRKELENVVINDGDAALVEDDFLERRPILFWNLVYVFHRLGAPTHFVSHIAKFYVLKFPRADGQRSLPSVLVRCVYEMPCFHREDPIKPVYFSLYVNSKEVQKPSDIRQSLDVEQCCVPRLIVQQILDCLATQNMSRPLQLLINDHRRRAKRSSSPALSLPKHCSIYRDILFVAWLHFGCDLNVEEFDSRYQKAFGQLSPKLASMLPAHDHPPGKGATACRRVFIPLDVI